MNLVFDLGGVVFDWDPAALLRRTLPEHAASADDVQRWVQRIFGHGGEWTAFDRGTIGVPALVERIARRTSLAPSRVRAVVDAVPAALRPRDDTAALLRRLKHAGRRLFYLSNMPAPLADHLERTHAVMQQFEGGVFSSRVGLVKPEAAIYALAQQRFGVARAADCVFLDDHAPNVEAARACGWHALQYRDAASAEAQLHAIGG